MITSEYWQNSEKLLNYLWPAIVAISCVICFVLIGVLASHGKKKVVISFLGIIMANLVIGFSTLIYTKPYRDLQQYATYKNRIYDVTIFNKNSLTDREIRGYSPEDIQKTNKLPFYSLKNNINSDEWHYLGRDEHLYFFKNQRDIFNVDTTNKMVTFENNAKSDVAIKEKYVELNDNSFLDAGFKETVGPSIDEIIIDSKLKDTTYKSTNKTIKLIAY